MPEIVVFRPIIYPFCVLVRSQMIVILTAKAVVLLMPNTVQMELRFGNPIPELL